MEDTGIKSCRDLKTTVSDREKLIERDVSSLDDLRIVKKQL